MKALYSPCLALLSLLGCAGSQADVSADPDPNASPIEKSSCRDEQGNVFRVDWDNGNAFATLICYTSSKPQMTLSTDRKMITGQCGDLMLGQGSFQGVLQSCGKIEVSADPTTHSRTCLFTGPPIRFQPLTQCVHAE